jgi:plastocyanin
MKTLCMLAAMIAGAVFIVGCANADGADIAGTKVIQMTSGLKYEPVEITVNVGDTVQWKNVSIMGHTVTADPALAKQADHVALPTGATPFNSGNIGPGKTFAYTFTVPGTYKYFCIPHESMGMVGRVIVKPAQTQH